jgi:Protein of unknown function (DUF1572)
VAERPEAREVAATFSPAGAMTREILTSIEEEYERYKKLGEGAFEQSTESELTALPAPDGNSIAIIVWHLSGNLKSRFTDFLTTDGEKPWRDRESEFVTRALTRGEVQAKWDDGWAVLFETLSTLDDSAMPRRITIRGEELSVLQALHRSLAHASYHVGQMVLLAKSFRGSGWRSLSIPRGGLPR